VIPREVVPQLLETDRGVAPTVGPEERDHLAERPRLRTGAGRRRAPDRAAHDLAEPHGVRPAIARDACEGLCRVERHVPPCAAGFDEVDALSLEAALQPIAMCRCRDHDRGLAGREPAVTSWSTSRTSAASSS
jgi:hypothetical protein